MTIVFGGRVLLFKDPCDEDVRLFATMQAARAKWEQEGRPESGLGF